MKYKVGDIVTIKHMNKIGVIESVVEYFNTKNGYHIIICGIPNRTFYYYDYELEKQ